MAKANVEWGVLYNITTFSRLTTGLSQLPDCLLTNHKQTETQRKKRRSHGGLLLAMPSLREACLRHAA
ncbi:hypothetical protein [Nostoc sp.]|uniref:hypothetical protein n=1 Tax=Nostoc sp. TaxID=1180 RepID=UPI002FFA369C